MNVQVLSDQVLLNHYLSGDRSAISKLIERHSRRVAVSGAESVPEIL